MEAVLSPHTTLAGKSIRDLHFREKYGVNVVGLYWQGQILTEDLRDQPLRFGDGLLLYGPLEKMKMLGV
jgi:di/tricarboxylate transporter